MPGPDGLAEAGLLQPPQDEAGQVELAFVVGLARMEEPVAARIVVGETIFKIDADLIAGGRDAGADDGDDVRAVRALLDHPRQGRLGDAAERTLPASMGGGDHAGLGRRQTFGEARRGLALQRRFVDVGGIDMVGCDPDLRQQFDAARAGRSQHEFRTAHREPVLT